MKSFSMLLILIIFSACSSRPKETIEVVREKWKGRTVKELEKHYYFKNLPLTKKKYDDGLESWIYRDQTNYQSSAYCQSLGGCMGTPFYNCDNIFSIKEGIIIGYDQNGSCPPVATIKPE